MTTFIVSMLVIAGIVLIARYYGSASMASDLLLTLAFSVVVGLGIQFATKENKSNKKITKIENSTIVTNPTSTQAMCVTLEPTHIDQTGSVGQVQDYITKKNDTPQQINNMFAFINRIAPPFSDSS